MTPEKSQRMGIEAPRGVFLYGPPGTGKTLIAKAVANETNASFISVRGPQLLLKWAGGSGKAVRQMFYKARQVSPTIIFFDELDALAPARDNDMDNSVSERVINQFLTELDGLEDTGNIVVIATVNRPDMIDPALIRSSQFGRPVLIGRPEEEGHEQILDIRTQQSLLAPDVSLCKIAEITGGYAGPDLESICHETTIEAFREDSGAKEIEVRHFRKAMESARPAITKELTHYYEDIQDQFKGSPCESLSPDTRDDGRIGFQ